MKLQRALSKFHDHYLGTDPSEYYYVLVRKLGALAGWYKASGAALADEINQTFPTTYPAPGGASIEQMAAQAKSLETFVTTAAPQCFPADVASAEAFSKFKNQLLHVATLWGRFAEHMASDPNFFAFAHANLNIDNAFWWRDASGALDAGVIDWAMCGVKEVTMSIDFCLFSAGWEVMEHHQAKLLQAFSEAYAAAGGPTLPLEELSIRFDMALALSLAGQLGVPPQLYRGIKSGEWPSVKSMKDDERVDGDTDTAFLMRSYLGNLVYRLTRWKRDNVYRKLCAWAGVAAAAGT